VTGRPDAVQPGSAGFGRVQPVAIVPSGRRVQVTAGAVVAAAPVRQVASTACPAAVGCQDSWQVWKYVAQVFAMVGDLGEAEDAVAEAFARAWQRWRKVHLYADPAAWVRTVAYRIAVSSWRRARGRRIAHHRWGIGADRAQLDPDTVSLVDALRTLPSNARSTARSARRDRIRPTRFITRLDGND